MYKNFDEILAAAKARTQKKTIAIAAAQDHEVLESAVEAKKMGLADFVLTGNADKIGAILNELGESATNWKILNEPDDQKATKLAVGMVASGEAHIPMKGLLHTATFLRAIFNKEYGLVEEKALVSCITVTEFPADGRLMLITDCAINVAPDYDAKVKLINNAVGLAKVLGMDMPKVAVVTAVETVNMSMPETVDAAILCKAVERGQIKGCLIDGPLALDNAISPQAAKTKGIEGPVAGKADILIMPNLLAGNILDKALRYFGELKTGSFVAGGKVPLIATSRSDSAANKIHAIALSVMERPS
ncbi:bifunctional enoyl-CoA hydratase/phosphate acetyltransferase [Desulfovibrio sp. OttesenSCG-928-F07]|nr:bifunctional enoyl-CoA hydratase/phosphate acetyltransferase [Desulfovibrio sp. OttesenSCG-928-F07]